MIFVNVPGSPVWPQLSHAPWDGLTAADVVFPAFLFTVGCSLAVARLPSAPRIARRVVLLVALGLVVNRATFDGPLRYPGVLQRIAICYLLGVLTVRLPRTAVAAFTLALLGGYALLLRSGGMTPGHSVAATVDVALFGRRHLYHGFSYDPEGLVSSIAATASVLLGFLTMAWLRARSRSRVTAAGLLAGGLALVLAGRTLDSVVPINKRLWTPSFTLVTAGMAVCALAVLFALIELGGAKQLAWPFQVIGANAIVVYVVSELAGAWLDRTHTHGRIYADWFVPWAGTRGGSLAFSVAFLALLWCLAAAMWRAHIIVRV
jgi:predicted acyltransferase